MSKPPYTPKVVSVGSNPLPAFDCPTLIVHQDGKYYVSLAVWVVDPKFPNPTQEQKDGIAAIEKLYRENYPLAASKPGAVVIDHTISMMPKMATPQPSSN